MVNHPNRSKQRRIPIVAAQRIAEEYRYDQVVIVARKVGDGGGEHVTTYGVDKANCDVAARIGNFLKHKVMGWPGAVTDAELVILLAHEQGCSDYLGDGDVLCGRENEGDRCECLRVVRALREAIEGR